MHASATCGPILVVDNDRQTCAVVDRLLHRAGYVSFVATTPAKALESARKERPRVVLLEVALPEVSGFELCLQLKNEVDRTLLIMLLSSRGTDPLDRVAGLLAGADDYLAKPFSPDELLARVRALTRRSEPTGAARLWRSSLDPPVWPWIPRGTCTLRPTPIIASVPASSPSPSVTCWPCSPTRARLPSTTPACSPRCAARLPK